MTLLSHIHPTAPFVDRRSPRGPLPTKCAGPVAAHDNVDPRPVVVGSSLRTLMVLCRGCRSGVELLGTSVRADERSVR